MKTLGYYDGKYDEIDRMTIPFDDRSHYYGDGVYDATCAGNHVIFNMEEHVDRFYNSAGLLRIQIPYTREELKEILTEMVKKVDADEVIVSSSSNFCLSAHEIDGQPVGGKAPEILATLRELLMNEYLAAIGRKA